MLKICFLDPFYYCLVATVNHYLLLFHALFPMCSFD